MLQDVVRSYRLYEFVWTVGTRVKSASHKHIGEQPPKKRKEEECCLATWNASNAWKLYQKSSWNEIAKVVEQKKGTSKNHRNKKKTKQRKCWDALTMCAGVHANDIHLKVMARRKYKNEIKKETKANLICTLIYCISSCSIGRRWHRR